MLPDSGPNPERPGRTRGHRLRHQLQQKPQPGAGAGVGVEPQRGAGPPRAPDAGIPGMQQAVHAVARHQRPHVRQVQRRGRERGGQRPARPRAPRGAARACDRRARLSAKNITQGTSWPRQNVLQRLKLCPSVSEHFAAAYRNGTPEASRPAKTLRRHGARYGAQRHSWFQETWVSLRCQCMAACVQKEGAKRPAGPR